MSEKGSKQRIVVVGGGYAGALAAVRLAGRARGRAEVTLVDPRTELVERLRLHQLATGQKVRGHDLARLTGRRVRTLRARAIAVDPDRGALAVEADGKISEVPFDQVVIAVGSTVDPGAVPGGAEHAHSLADPAAAIRLREALRELPESGRVVVCGGGFTGVEAASEVAAARPDLRVSMVSAGPVGRWLSRRGAAELESRLRRLGVELVEGEKVATVEPGTVVFEGGSGLPADLAVWCGGFVAQPLMADSGLPVDARGLLAVDPTLRSVGHDNVIGAGDAAAIPDFPNGARYRMTCQAGMPSGAHAADTAVAQLRGEEPAPFEFGYIHQPISLGRRDGLIQWVDRADQPKEKVLVGRRAVVYKELVTRGAVPSIRWERRLPGMLRWPSTGRAAIRPAPVPGSAGSS